MIDTNSASGLAVKAGFPIPLKASLFDLDVFQSKRAVTFPDMPIPPMNCNLIWIQGSPSTCGRIEFGAIFHPPTLHSFPILIRFTVSSHVFSDPIAIFPISAAGVGSGSDVIDRTFTQTLDAHSITGVTQGLILVLVFMPSLAQWPEDRYLRHTRYHNMLYRVCITKEDLI